MQAHTYIHTYIHTDITDRKAGIHTYINTYIHTGRHTYIQTDRRTQTETARQPDIHHIYILTYRHTDRQTDRHTGRQTGTQADRQAGRHTCRHLPLYLAKGIGGLLDFASLQVGVPHYFGLRSPLRFACLCVCSKCSTLRDPAATAVLPWPLNPIPPLYHYDFALSPH